MKYCIRCGKELDDSAAFCSACGASCAAPCETAVVVEPVREEKPKRGTNVMAIVGFALAFSVPIAGIIVSSIAKKNAATGEYRNPLAELARWGVIIGIIETVIAVICIIVWGALYIGFAAQLLRMIGERIRGIEYYY